MRVEPKVEPPPQAPAESVRIEDTSLLPADELAPVEGGLLSSPTFWIVVGGVVALGTGVALAVAFGSTEEEHYQGTAGLVLLGLGSP